MFLWLWQTKSQGKRPKTCKPNFKVHCCLIALSTNNGPHGRRWRRAPLLTKTQTEKLLKKKAKMPVDEPERFWENVRWTDETKLMGKIAFKEKQKQKAQYRLWNMDGGLVLFYGCIWRGVARVCLKTNVKRNPLPRFRKLSLTSRSWAH